MTPKSYTTEQMSTLEKEFDSLTTVEERLDFWREKLRFRYTLWSDLEYWGKSYAFFEQRLDHFYIRHSSRATVREETERLNLLMLDEVKEMDLISAKKKLLDFDELKARIDEKISEAVRPIPILENELKLINELIGENRQEEKNPYLNIEIIKRNEIKKAWLRGFDEYYYNGKEPDYQRTTSETVFLVGVHNGNTIAKYMEHLESRLKNPSIKKVSASKKETSLKQQLLMLRHTGMLQYFDGWQQKDKEYFLATLLNRSPQTIKEAFIDLYRDRLGNEIWTENNLSFLINHFSKIGLSKETAELKQDLEKLKIEQDRLKGERK